MTRIVLTIAVLFFNSLTLSQTAKKEGYTLTITKGKVVKEYKQTFWVTPTTLTNNTKNTLRYFSMSCSWQDFYSVDNNKLQIGGVDCDKNVPTILIIAPRQTKTVELRLLMSQTMDASEMKFKIGLNLMKVPKTQKPMDFKFREERKKKNLIWSNVIFMLMDERPAGNSPFAIGGVLCSASTIVVKSPPIANLPNVTGNPMDYRTISN